MPSRPGEQRKAESKVPLDCLPYCYSACARRSNRLEARVSVLPHPNRNRIPLEEVQKRTKRHLTLCTLYLMPLQFSVEQ